MRLLLLALFISLISGCATYRQDVDEGLSLARQGQWQEAESVFDKALDSPKDQLLYYMEKGALAQYRGDYQRSNELLEQAERLSDTFFSSSFSDRAWALLSNPRQGSYRGNGVERVYISYLKSLNYLALSEAAPQRQARVQLLDSALVEARRIDLKLNEISAQTLSYEDLEAQENQPFYLKAMDWLGNFYSGGRSTEQYQYREDAWGRYLEGLQYEASEQYDDARISYTDAAQLYQQGYAEQYNLSQVTAQRAWLDAIRMMQKSGWSAAEITQAKDEHLNSEMLALYDRYQTETAELVILEHQGFIPDKSEMSLLLYPDPQSYSLLLDPIIPNNASSRNLNDYDEFRWFTMVYSDLTPLSMIANYKNGGGWDVFTGIFTKRVLLGKAAWQQLDSLQLDKMLYEIPLRVTVPFYRRFELDARPTVTSLQGAEKIASDHSIRMASLADIAFQDQLANAQRDIYESLVREVIRAWLAYQVQSQLTQDDALGMLFNLASQVTLFASSAAETRNWLTLPAQVRLTRIPMAPGDYQPTYKASGTEFSMGPITLENNELKVWNLRNPN